MNIVRKLNNRYTKNRIIIIKMHKCACAFEIEWGIVKKVWTWRRKLVRKDEQKTR